LDHRLDDDGAILPVETGPEVRIAQPPANTSSTSMGILVGNSEGDEFLSSIYWLAIGWFPKKAGREEGFGEESSMQIARPLSFHPMIP
jgi:hypothetical protein